jgi:hypothetical protein
MCDAAESNAPRASFGSCSQNWFAAAAVLEHPALGPGGHDRESYLALAELWARVFPDGHIALEHVKQRGDTIYEVDVVGTGTHLGDFDMGGYGMFRATGNKATLKFRELFEIRAGTIAYLSLTLDPHDFVRQLGGRRTP